MIAICLGGFPIWTHSVYIWIYAYLSWIGWYISYLDYEIDCFCFCDDLIWSEVVPIDDTTPIEHESISLEIIIDSDIKKMTCTCSGLDIIVVHECHDNFTHSYRVSRSEVPIVLKKTMSIDERIEDLSEFGLLSYIEKSFFCTYAFLCTLISSEHDLTFSEGFVITYGYYIRCRRLYWSTCQDDGIGDTSEIRIDKSHRIDRVSHGIISTKPGIH